MGARTMSGVPKITVTNMHGTSVGLPPPSAAWSCHRDEHKLMGQDVQQIWHTTAVYSSPSLWDCPLPLRGDRLPDLHCMVKSRYDAIEFCK